VPPELVNWPYSSVVEREAVNFLVVGSIPTSAFTEVTMKPLRCFLGFHKWTFDEHIKCEAHATITNKIMRSLITRLVFETHKCLYCGKREYKDSHKIWHRVDKDRKVFIFKVLI
jgi:hypothetical protein